MWDKFFLEPFEPPHSPHFSKYDPQTCELQVHNFHFAVFGSASIAPFI